MIVMNDECNNWDKKSLSQGAGHLNISEKIWYLLEQNELIGHILKTENILSLFTPLMFA